MQHAAAASQDALHLHPRQRRERADQRDVVARELDTDFFLRARQRSEGVRRQERGLVAGPHVHHRLGLQDVRRHLAHHLVAGEPHRDRQPQPSPDLAPDLRRDIERRAEQLARPGEIAVDVPEDVRLYHGDDGSEDRFQRLGGAAVQGQARRQDHEVGAAAQRLVDRHPHRDPRERRLGRGRPDDRPIGPARRERDRPPTEACADAALDGDGKRERVDVQDDAIHRENMPEEKPKIKKTKNAVFTAR